MTTPTKKAVKEYNKMYYENNKEKHLKYMTEKIICEVCNCSISRGHISSHRRTKRHLRELEINGYKNILNNVNNVIATNENMSELKSIINNPEINDKKEIDKELDEDMIKLKELVDKIVTKK